MSQTSEIKDYLIMELVEVAYFTRNLSRLVSYYRILFGCDPIAESDGMAIFLVGGVKILIHQTYTPAAGELPPENHIAFAVRDVDALCHDLLAGGMTLEIAPNDYYWGRSAYLRDPDGHVIELSQKANP